MAELKGAIGKTGTNKNVASVGGLPTPGLVLHGEALVNEMKQVVLATTGTPQPGNLSRSIEYGTHRLWLAT
jgi:hypothetical protein